MITPSPLEPPDGSSQLKIWLAYVSYPITTAAYIERALRKVCPVVTLGPKIESPLIEAWNLQDLKVPIPNQDIQTGFEPDLKEILSKIPPEHHPDFFLWIESVPGFHPKNLDALPCPTACYMIDTHLNATWHPQWARMFDYTFVVHRDYVPFLQQAGCCRVNWLPVACDPEIHQKSGSKKTHDISFIGTIQPGHPRSTLLESIRSRFNLHVERCFWTDMTKVFSESKLVFNRAVKNDLNMRVFETLSTGSALLTDDAGEACGLHELFKDGEDLLIYNESNLHDKIDYYLKHEAEREAIARSGMEKVHRAHTYAHRVNALLNVVLGHTYSTPDAREWRAWSEGKPSPFFPPPISPRSFVIPVLDKSPASPFNIETLLKDLESIEGEVIVVFNSPAMAEQFGSHPRITRSITVSQNVGVARAWNLGLHLSRTPVTFVCNADLHLLPKAVPVMEKFLMKLEKAAIVGPMGAFFDYFSSTDYLVLQKGQSPRPVQVDAVSGFLFAVKTEHFQKGPLVFEDDYTPCYFEEWDLGIQCRRAGLTCWTVPVTDYDHEWSGTIRAHRVVKFYDQAEPIESIHERNTRRFWQKWMEIAQSEKNPNLLTSRWPEHLRLLAKESKDPAQAQSFLQQADGIEKRQQREVELLLNRL